MIRASAKIIPQVALNIASLTPSFLNRKCLTKTYSLKTCSYLQVQNYYMFSIQNDNTKSLETPKNNVGANENKQSFNNPNSIQTKASTCSIKDNPSTTANKTNDVSKTTVDQNASSSQNKALQKQIPKVQNSSESKKQQKNKQQQKNKEEKENKQKWYYLFRNSMLMGLAALGIKVINYIGPEMLQTIQQINQTVTLFDTPLYTEGQKESMWESPSLQAQYQNFLSKLFDDKAVKCNAINVIVGPNSIGKDPNLRQYLTGKNKQKHYPIVIIQQKEAYNNYKYFLEHPAFKIIYRQSFQRVSKSVNDFFFNWYYNRTYKERFGQKKKSIILVIELSDFKLLQPSKDVKHIIQEKHQLLKKLYKLQTSTMANINNVNVILVFSNLESFREMERMFIPKWFQSLILKANSPDDIKTIFNREGHQISNIEHQKLITDAFNVITPINRIGKKIRKENVINDVEKQTQIIKKQIQKYVSEGAQRIQKIVQEKPKDYTDSEKHFRDTSINYLMKICLQQDLQGIKHKNYLKHHLNRQNIMFDDKFSSKGEMRQFQRFAENNKLWSTGKKNCHKDSYQQNNNQYK